MARLRFCASQQWRFYQTSFFHPSRRASAVLPNRPCVRQRFWSVSIFSAFSTAPNLEFPRNKPLKSPNKSIYPSFRNESVEHRYVREHNLFNPDSSENNLRDGAPPAVLRKVLTTSKVLKTDIADLEREMIWLANNSPQSSRLNNLLRKLIVTKRVKPNVIHYEALILANTLSEYGSAENVRQLLAEMDKYDIPQNSTIYTAVLRTMVVHPDLDIVAQVIESCARLWIEIDLEMLHLISAAYLRAGMTELAMDYLEQVETTAQNSGSKIELWLYVLFIRQLAIAGDWDAVLRMCYRLNDDPSLGIPLAMRQVDVPYDFWHWLLEYAAAAGDVWVTIWIWKIWVLRHWIQPRPELCVRVLELAANAGLLEIAESASAILKFMTPIHQVLHADADDEQYQVDQQHIQNLLAQAHRKSGVNSAESGKQSKRSVIPQWWMLGEDQDILNEFGARMRFDPWAVLDKKTDPGRAWPRILRERQEEEEDQKRTRVIGAAGWAKRISNLRLQHDRPSTIHPIDEDIEMQPAREAGPAVDKDTLSKPDRAR